MRDPNEALVFLARHEYAAGGPRAHERLMFVAVLYSAGASHVAIDAGDTVRSATKGVTVHLPAGRAATRVIEQVIASGIDRHVITSNVRQRGNLVHLEWS
jgi:hypothetical protein